MKMAIFKKMQDHPLDDLIFDRKIKNKAKKIVT